MSRRYYAKGKKTYAKDQSFEQDQVGEEKERYLISIDLMSLKIFPFIRKKETKIFLKMF